MEEDKEENKLDEEIRRANEEMEQQIEANLQAESSENNDILNENQEDTENQEQNNDQNSENEEENKEDNSAQNQEEQAQEEETNQENDNHGASSEHFDGISRAYGDADIGDFDNKAPKSKEDFKTKTSSGVTPPKRERGGTKGKSGGDNIMEVFWNDCIMAFYAWSIDTIVDNTLDFAEWVLFAKYKSEDVKEPKEEKKKNIYMIGSEFHKERMANLAKEKEKLCELNENLAKQRDGINPTWNAWNKEPEFYNKLKQIYNQAMDDPHSAEARFIHKYSLGAEKEIIDGRFAKEEKIFTLAVRMATIEEVVNDEMHVISPTFSRNLKNLENKVNQRSNDLDAFKQDVVLYINTLTSEIGEENVTNTKILQKLEALKQSAIGGPDISHIKKDAKKTIKEIKQINKEAIDSEDVVKPHILNRSKEIYSQIMGNIDKIHETYPNDENLTKETIKNYLISINEAGKAAKVETDKIINLDIEKRSKNTKAKKAVENIGKAINEFDLDGTGISSRHEAAQKDEFVLTEKQFAKAIREYRFSR